VRAIVCFVFEGFHSQCTQKYQSRSSC